MPKSLKSDARLVILKVLDFMTEEKHLLAPKIPFDKVVERVAAATDVVPVRFNLWVMLFTSCWVVYMLRVNMSLNLIAMVPHDNKISTTMSQCDSKDEVTNVTFHNTDISDVREAPRQVHGGASFDWSAEQQATILGAYFWCYPITSLVGGMAAERWGPRYVVLACSIASAVLTALSPAAARLGHVCLIVVRFLLGFAGDSPLIWKHIWCFHGLVLFLSGVIFLIWGETSLQSWNSIKIRPRARKKVIVRPKHSIMSNITEIEESDF